MAKASRESTTTWISWSEAKQQAVVVFEKIVGKDHAPEFAERLIRDGLEAGRIAWSCSYSEGKEQQLIGRAEFFHDGPVTPAETTKFDLESPLLGMSPLLRMSPFLHYVWIELDKNSASRDELAVYRGKLDKDAFAKLLPAVEADSADAKTRTKNWVFRKAQELKRTGKLDPLILKTRFAELLADHLKEAAKADASLKAVESKSIRNKLDEWGLWPISKI